MMQIKDPNPLPKEEVMYSDSPFPFTKGEDQGADFKNREDLKIRLHELAENKVYVGTSSWKYEGWLGLFYEPQRYHFRGTFSKKRFEDHCLAEYAQTFKTVCVDATYYQFPEAKLLDQWFSLVPSDFKFGFKVPSDITLKHFPKLPRYGAKAGQQNKSFLNPDLFAEKFLIPCETHSSNVGLFIFEFSRFHSGDYQRGRDFVDDLDRFLSNLPKGWNYGVEIRNRSFLQPEYFNVLARHDVAHIFNQWTLMNPVGEQLRLPQSQTTDFLAARFLLSPGRTYEQAVAQFSPYRETKVVDEEGRNAGREIIARAQKNGKRASFIFVNNRFEGNSLHSIRAMVHHP